MSAPPMIRPGERVGDRFLVTALAGSGGMGSVFEARDESTGEKVAVKVLRREHARDAARFAREVELLARLRHPAIVRYVAHGATSQGLPYLAMEWLTGDTLGERLSLEGLSVSETVQLALRISEALGEVHAAGLLHRDIKPGNIIFPGGVIEEAKLIDFGIARPIEQVSGLTEIGSSIGTPGYMSPEQVRGASNLTAASDVFGLGCLIYECLAGRGPFDSRNILALQAKTLFLEPRRVTHHRPDASDALAALVSALLAKTASARPKDAGELAERLRALPPIPDGPKRVTRPSSAQSATSPLQGLGTGSRSLPFSLIVGAPDPGITPAAQPGDIRLRRVAAAADPFGGRAEVFPDGAIMVLLTLEGTPPEQAVAAAGCAFIVRRIAGELPVVLSVQTAESDDAVASTIDQAVETLAADAMATVFKGYDTQPLPTGAVRIDETLASLLRGQLDVRDDPRGAYIVPPEAGRGS